MRGNVVVSYTNLNSSLDISVLCGVSLKEIGDLKRQSGDVDEALLVYCTLGEDTLLENPDVLSVTGYDVLDTCLDACKLLPDDMHFSDAQKYTYASAALSTKQYDLATTVFNAITADYADAATQALESQYKKGAALLAEKEYDKATETFSAIDAYKDASTKALESQYEKGTEQLASGKFDAATATFNSISEYGDSATQAVESQYQKGKTQLADHDYDAAIATFESISDYKDASEQMTEGQYQKALSLFQSGDYNSAKEIYSALGKYKDAEGMAVESLYQYGCSLIDKNKYEDAIEVLKPLNGYKDVYERVTTNESLRYTLISSLFKVGDTITFGHFGESDLNWYIIKASGKSRYLITTQSVDKRQFNSRNSYRDKDRGQRYHWGNSDLRSWLNGKFYESAFSSSEKAKISKIKVKYQFRIWHGKTIKLDDFSYDDKVSGISWIPNFSRYDLPAEIREKLEADYWTGGVSNNEDTYKVSDNNSGSDYSWIFAAYTMTNYGCPMTEKHGVRPVIQIDLEAFTDKDVEALWQRNEFNQPENEESTMVENSVSFETLKVGSKGNAVIRLQQALIDQGYLSGKADGDFGNKTAEAVKKAQKAFKMEQTGVADDAFQKILFNQ